jgi:hypothetical protein
MNLALNAQKGIILAQRSILYSSLTSSYQLVGAVFPAPLVQLIIVSTLNDSVQFSWDGIIDAFPIVAGANIILDIKANGIIESANQGCYVKTLGSPSSGSLYFGGFTV